MCGRYALSLRPSQVRRRLADQNMPADEAPDDDDARIRQSYNFAPGYHGLIYRAESQDQGENDAPDNSQDDGEPMRKRAKHAHEPVAGPEVDGMVAKEIKYKLQAARWGLIPFWTKRPPDYGSQMRTINCRDDSLIENRGMWNTMKQRKRCIVVAEGFYEWLKKDGGKTKLPHFVKRKDGELMCFAGLWDMVKYEGSEEKLYTYTVITTDPNKQLRFLHDRMPVILEPGSEQMRAWLDPKRIGWDKELQSMLKPFDGELECYQVDKDVGKVGNNSPQFVVPIDSKDNKKNIANFFGKQQAAAKDDGAKTQAAQTQREVLSESADQKQTEADDRATSKVEDPETGAPLPKPEGESDEQLEQAIKQDTSEFDDGEMHNLAEQTVERGIKREISELDDASLLKAAGSPSAKESKSSPSSVKNSQGRRTRSATTNHTVAKTPTKEGNAKITSFFGK